MTTKTANETLIKGIRMLGFGEALAPRIAEFFKNDEGKATTMLREDPYCLMEIDGIGFIKADQVARAVFRLKEEDPRRQRALILKALDDNKNLGHTFLPVTILDKELQKNKVIQHEGMMKELESLGRIVVKGNKIFLKRLHDAEQLVAMYLKDRAQQDKYAMSVPFDDDLVLKVTKGFVPDPDQMEAIKTFRTQNMMVLTGGPGTGKTQTIKAICAMANTMHLSFALCAPTGKAAKRMQDLTGWEAMTIHRLLKAGWGSWRHNAAFPLKGYRIVIVDECSMLDIELAYHLLDALPLDTKIIFVGDVDQLPPVGPGSFFRDLIKSKLAKVVRLRTNHRQGLGSGIADNALRINEGGLKLSFDDDITFIDCASPIAIRENIAKSLGMLSKDYDLVRDVQILTPQKQTTVGTYSLNELLRFTINKNANAKEKFSIGDKVMQTYNNYELEIYNGFIGIIRGVSSMYLDIEFYDDDRPIIKYPMKNAEELMQAWACTIHKYQGSEAKAGIPIISSSHIYMLSRNLLYTAITRFKEKCIIMGDTIALRKAIVNNREAERYSDLPNLLDPPVR